MKSTILSLFFILAFCFFASTSRADQPSLLVKGVDITTWPNEISPAHILEIYIELMKADPKANSLLLEAKNKLKNHGIGGIENIFNYCTGEPPQPGATAFFSQNSDILESRISIPGIPEVNWDPATLIAKQKAFSYKIIKTPFLEFFIATDIPQICIHKGKELFYGYDSFVHELTHFVLKDPFTTFEKILSSKPLPDYVDFSISEKGGELDAFKMGGGAGIRLLSKYQIQSNSSGSYQYFSSQGELIDESGLKAYLVKNYTTYYNNSNTLSQIKSFKQNFLNLKIKTLKEIVQPYLKTINRPDLVNSAEQEIATLEKLLL